MTALATLDTHRQAGLLTAPYRRGAELLDVPLGADVAGATIVGAYAFTEYHARYGREPGDPRYLLVLKKDTGSQPLSVAVDFQVAAGPVVMATVAIPAHSLSGMSFYVPLPQPVPDGLRLRALRQTSAVIPGPGAELFGVVALLGNIARLLWIIGAEKDEVRRQLGVVRDQRRRISSQRVALDLLGADLRVARFPAREYSFDGDTIALYHCNDAVPDLGAVADETTRFGLPGHPGINQAAESEVDGQFGAGFGFPGPTGAGAITIDDHADFALPPSQSATIEAFVNVVAAVLPTPRVLLLKGTVDAACTLTSAGWSMVAGEFRGIPNNLRCSLSDGNPANIVDLFADLNLADGRFHHVAVIVDRTANRVRLLVDGQERASDGITLAALTNGEQIRVGSSAAGHACTGVIDEIRFSRVARTSFHPALGEDDEDYRTRLGIFERWTLPTAAELTRLINNSVAINGDPESFVIAETTRPFAAATKKVRVVPSELPAGASIDREGDGRIAIDAALDDAEPIFDARLLVMHANANVLYAQNASQMQAVARRALDRLLDIILGLIVGPPGKLHLDQAFDPSGPVRHSTGRTLLFSHDVIALAALGALAHRAGFDFVRNTGSFIEATVGLGDELEAVVEPRAAIDTPPDGVDVLPTKSIDLHVDPGGLPTAGELRWTLIPCGAGRARFVAHPADAAALTTRVETRPHLRLTADAPGQIVVKVDYALGGRVYTGSRTIRIGVAALADNTAISAAGEFNPTAESAAGQTGAVIDPILLVIGTNPLIDYGTNPDNKRMQVTLDRRLSQLAGAVGGLGLAAGLVAAGLWAARRRVGAVDPRPLPERLA